MCSDTLDCMPLAVATRTAQALLPIVNVPLYRHGRRMAAHVRTEPHCALFAVAESPQRYCSLPMRYHTNATVKGNACVNCVQFAVATRTAQAPLPIVSAPSYLRGRRMTARLRSDTLGCVPFAVAECTARAVRLIANALFVSARPSKRDACMQRYARLERFAVATHTAQALLPVVNVPAYRCGVQWRSVCAATRSTAQHLLWLHHHKRYCSSPVRPLSVRRHIDAAVNWRRICATTRSRR